MPGGRERFATGLLTLVVAGVLAVSGRVLAESGDVSEYAARADEMYRCRAQAGRAEESVAVLEGGLAAYPENYDILWRLARAYEFIGVNARKQEKLATFEKARSYAERATKANPNGLDGWYWYGLTIGRWGETRGILQSLSMAGPMRDALQKALEIDPEHWESYHVLGCLYRELPGIISFGNINKAIEYFDEAIVLSPNDVELRLDAAKALIKKRDYARAREHLAYLLALANDPEDPGSDEQCKDEARTLLKNIEGK